MGGILKLMPDLHITVARWRAQAPRASTAFLELVGPSLAERFRLP
jgi:hypothetical protein